jgi:predicted PurR-regulated permease PerM
MGEGRGNAPEPVARLVEKAKLRGGLADSGGAVSVAAWCIIALAIVTTLYVGAGLLIPIALSLLLAFVLSPLISWAKRRRIPRPLAVVVSVTLAFGIILGLGATFAGQVGQLAGDLPKYQSTMRDKIQSLRGWTLGSGTLERAADMLESLGKEFDAPKGGGTLRPGEPAGARPADAPTLVEIREPPKTALENLRDIASPLMHPLATMGIIAVFLIFILLEREDLRNRLMGLAGARDIQRTTAAIDDAARR